MKGIIYFERIGNYELYVYKVVLIRWEGRYRSYAQRCRMPVKELEGTGNCDVMRTTQREEIRELGGKSMCDFCLA